MGKLEINKQRKQSALFDAALELFTTKGFSKTTISDISEKAGVAKGTFYLYFNDKYDLRDQLAVHKLQELFYEACQAMEMTSISDFREQLIFLISYNLDKLSHDHSLFTFITRTLTWGLFSNAFAQELSKEDSFMSWIMQSFLDRSRRYYRYPEFMLFTITELVWSTCYNCILYSRPVSLESYKPHLFRSIDAIMQSFRLENAEQA